MQHLFVLLCQHLIALLVLELIFVAIGHVVSCNIAHADTQVSYSLSLEPNCLSPGYPTSEYVLEKSHINITVRLPIDCSGDEMVTCCKAQQQSYAHSTIAKN